VNIAFDANNMRLAMIWHNAFIDAAKHWLGRGPGYQTPLGDNVLELHDGAPLATLVDPKAPWPTQTARQLGHRFLGYRLDEHHRPIFKYRFGDVQVEDYSEPVSDKEFAPLRRTLQFTARQANKDLWFRALAAKSIDSKGNGTYLVDGQWTIKLSASHGQPLLRQTRGKAELLVPILAESSSETVRQEFFW
jgi:hypothetical protein